MLSVEDIAAHMYSLPDVEHEPVDEQTVQAVAQLARLLSDTVGEAAEDALVSDIRKTGVIGPIVRLLASHRERAQLLYLGLSILVNLADTGGADVVTMHRGTDLLLQLLHSADENAAYYAVAGVQNVRALPATRHVRPRPRHAAECATCSPAQADTARDTARTRSCRAPPTASTSCSTRARTSGCASW